MKIRKNTELLFFSGLLLFSINSVAQDKTRSFDQSHLEQVIEDNNLDYRDLTPADGFQNWLQEKINRMIQSILEWLLDLLRSAGVENPDRVLQIIFYSILVLILGFALYRLFRMKGSELFHPAGNQRHMPGLKELSEENYAGLLAESLQKKENKLAVRYYYLYALQLLSRKEEIQPGAGKTNQDYLNELQHKPSHIIFSKISHIFEYVWYGDFPASESMLEDLENNLRALKEHLHVKVTA